MDNTASKSDTKAIIKNYASNYINSQEFYDKVKSIANEKDFFEACFNQLAWQNKINNLTREITSSAKSEIDSRCQHWSNENRKWLDNTLTKTVSKSVSDELTTQFRNYLSNDYQVQQLLMQHITCLNDNLKHTADQYLKGLIADPQYNILLNTHLNHSISQLEENLTIHKINCENQLTCMKQESHSHLQGITKDYNERITELISDLRKLDFIYKECNDAHTQHIELRREFEELKNNSITFGQIAMVMIGAVSATLIGVYFITK